MAAIDHLAAYHRESSMTSLNVYRQYTESVLITPHNHPRDVMRFEKTYG